MTGNPNDEYGLPLRQVPLTPTQTQVQFQRRVVEDREVYIFVLDTGDNRSMTVWQREELEGMLRAGLSFLGVIPDGLLIANADDMPKR